MKSSIVFYPTENVTHTKIQAFSAASANVITDPIYLAYAEQFAISAFWTGAAPVGTFTLEASTDIERVLGQAVVNGVADPNIVNWVTIGGSSQATATGSPLMWNYSNVGYRWVRVKYLFTSGTIILSETVQIKGGL